MRLASKEGEELATKPLPPAAARKVLGCYAEPQGASKASLVARTHLVLLLA